MQEAGQRTAEPGKGAQIQGKAEAKGLKRGRLALNVRACFFCPFCPIMSHNQKKPAAFEKQGHAGILSFCPFCPYDFRAKDGHLSAGKKAGCYSGCYSKPKMALF